VLYPIEYVSSTTKDGVIGFLPGTPLRVVEDKGDTIVVSDGKKKGEVSADKLTNDLDFMAQQNAAFDRDERQIEAKQAANYVPWGSSLDRGPWHERGSLSVREWIYNPEYPESRSPPSNVVYADGSGRPYWIDSYGHWRYDRK
jgi:hypothetical protein